LIEVMKLDELEKLEESDKINQLREYRKSYTIKDLTQAWGLSNPIQYYMWLKKQNIYEHLVRKSDRFDPAKEWKRLQEREYSDGSEKARIRGVSADQFRYTLDTDSTGPELAQVFRRLSDFLQNEAGHFRCKIELKAVAGQAQLPKEEWKDEEEGA